MDRLAQKIALITGGDNGVGLATAKEFVREGAHVFLTGRRDPDVNEVVKQIGGNVTGVQADLANLCDLDRVFAQIRQEKGRLDIVFVNVCIASAASCGRITEEYDPTFNTILKAVFFTAQKALRLLTNGGSIILNASIDSEKEGKIDFDNATRSALCLMVQIWAAELQRRSIRVNAVPVDSFAHADEVARQVLLLASDDSRFIAGTDSLFDRDSVSNHVLLGRMATPEEIADAVVFLASDDSSSINGTELLTGGDIRQQVNLRKKKLYEN